MPERFTDAERSRIMAAVKSRDTTPEIVVRKLIHHLGYRFRLYRKDLPGTPDIVLPRLHKIINVHGCFWHRHTCPRGRRSPLQNADYWNRKRAANVRRDRRTLRQLRAAGWQVLTLWECQTRDMEKLAGRVESFLRKKG